VTDSHWAERTKHWSKITAPMRPHEGSISKQQELVGDKKERILLLGVTPELHAAFPIIHAVDREQSMIDTIWPGDTEHKQVTRSDWFDIDLYANHYSAIVGDGSLNMVHFHEETNLLLRRCLDWLEPGGIAAFRVFTRPNHTPTKGNVITATKTMCLDAWRCYLNMYIAGTYGVNVPSQRKLDVFNELFPDREALASETGWELDSINRSFDSYKNGKMLTSYPTRDQWKAIIPDYAVEVGFDETSRYELCEYFPILTFRKMR